MDNPGEQRIGHTSCADRFPRRGAEFMLVTGHAGDLLSVVRALAEGRVSLISAGSHDYPPFLKRNAEHRNKCFRLVTVTAATILILLTVM